MTNAISIEAKVAAKWWTNAIQNPSDDICKDLGIDEQTTSGQALSVMAIMIKASRKTPSASTLEKFEQCLALKIDEALQSRANDFGL